MCRGQEGTRRRTGDVDEDPDRPERGDGGDDRLRTLGRAGTLGFALAALGVLAPAVAGAPVRDVNGVVFPLSALVFGFGLASWASALLYGVSLDRVAALAAVGDDWSSERVADAMSVLTVFGVGGMAGATLATELVVAL